MLSDSEALFVNTNPPLDGGGYVNAEFAWDTGTWRLVRWGACDIQPVFEGLGPASWSLAPGQRLASSSTAIAVTVRAELCKRQHP